MSYKSDPTVMINALHTHTHTQTENDFQFNERRSFNEMATHGE